MRAGNVLVHVLPSFPSDAKNSRVLRVNKKGHGTVLKANEKHGKYDAVFLKKAEFGFTTRQLVGHCQALAIKESQYLVAQTELARKCCTIGATYGSVLEKLSNILAEIDVLAAFALVCQCSTKTEWVRAKISTEESRELSLKDSTHPIVQETR